MFLHLNVSKDKIKVWVLAPYVQTNDANIDYYYDFSQSIDEYTKTFAKLGLQWQWQPVTMQTYATVIDKIEEEKNMGVNFPIVLNICDGDEVNGTPGISVVKLLKEKELIFTGADEYFYDITTSKIPMKEAFEKAGVATPKWEAILSKQKITKELFEQLGTPIIVKPSVSGGSMGVGVKNVVENIDELNEQVAKMFDGYRGWNLASDGLIAEQFIAGPEYTVFISGSYNNPLAAKVYTPVERVFHSSLPENQKFLSFDRLWEIYEDEEAMPNEDNFYEYALPDEKWIDQIKKISWDAYVACKGVGYTRVDVRQDAVTKKMYVLEVNAQCGLSEDENFTSIGAILRFSNATFSNLIKDILEDAVMRYSPADYADIAEKSKI
jgi:D-alanine-D-alanine ligase